MQKTGGEAEYSQKAIGDDGTSMTAKTKDQAASKDGEEKKGMGDADNEGGHETAEANGNPSSEKKTASWGHLKPDELPYRLNESAWSGHPETMFGPKGKKPWANFEVFAFWDLVRAISQLVTMFSAIVTYFTTDWDGELFGLSVFSFSAGSSSSTFGGFGQLMAVWSWITQWLFILDLGMIMIMVSSMKHQTYSGMYMLMAKLHSAWHKGNPPFVPIDTSSGTCQAALLSLSATLVVIISKILCLVLNPSRADQLVMTVAATGMMGDYLLLSGYLKHCQFRCLYALKCIADESGPDLPQNWNGITVHAISYCSHGPRFEYIEGQLLLMPPFKRESKSNSKMLMGNKPSWWMAANGVSQWLGWPAMLMTWQISTLSVISSILPVFTYMIVMMPLYFKYLGKAAKRSMSNGMQDVEVDIKAWTVDKKAAIAAAEAAAGRNGTTV